MIVEWNVHLFSADTERYPFHPAAVYRPESVDRLQDPLSTYLDRMERAGIDLGILVQPEPYGDDHQLVLDALQREPNRLRATSLFYPNDSQAPGKLEELVRLEPRIVATRFHAHRGKETYLESFADTGVRALWRKAAELGLIVELHIGPDYALQVAAAIREFPETPVLIDHLAEPHLGTAVEYAHVLDLAQFPNVYMKLSGLGHFAPDPPLYESALPFTHRVVSAFTPDRLVWGSGTPDIVDKHLADYSSADRAKVKGQNLYQLLNWGS